jgi:hypothetical protein
MIELFRVFSLIAMSRLGPQDLPAAPILLALTVGAYYLANYALNLAMPIVDSWRLHLLIDVAFNLGWFAVLLRAFQKPERFLQTTTAMFGYNLVLSPPWILAAWLMRRAPEDSFMQVSAAFIGLAMAIWMIRAGSYVLKAALELPMLACVVLTILQLLAGQLVLVALTPEEQAASSVEVSKVKD